VLNFDIERHNGGRGEGYNSVTEDRYLVLIAITIWSV
jgi:hypothetical protein